MKCVKFVRKVYFFDRTRNIKCSLLCKSCIQNPSLEFVLFYVDVSQDMLLLIFWVWQPLIWSWLGHTINISWYILYCGPNWPNVEHICFCFECKILFLFKPFWVNRDKSKKNLGTEWPGSKMLPIKAANTLHLEHPTI